MTAQTLGRGLAGAATTMLARTMTRRAMHDRRGAPRLPRAAQRNQSFWMVIALATAAGVLLAVGDVLQQQRKRVSQV